MLPNCTGGYGIRPYVNTKGPLVQRGLRRWAVGDCDLAHISVYPRTRSNPSVTAYAVPPAYASGPSVAARHLPTLWGVTLYTREALRWAVGGGVLDAPYNLALPPNCTGGYGIRPYGLLPIGLTKAHRKPEKTRRSPPKKVCGGFCVQRGIKSCRSYYPRWRRTPCQRRCCPRRLWAAAGAFRYTRHSR